jgi:hypothetical protein
MKLTVPMILGLQDSPNQIINLINSFYPAMLEKKRRKYYSVDAKVC